MKTTSLWCYRMILIASVCATLASAQTLAPTQTGNASIGYVDANDYASEGVPANWLTVNWWNGSQNVGLLQFDLSGFSSISSAELNLYQWANGGNGAEFGLFANTSAWTESSVGGLLANAPTMGAQVGSFSITDDGVGVWRSVDITPVANQWANGSLPNYGLTLERIDQANPEVYFGASSLYNDYVPTLVIDGGEKSVPDSGATIAMLGGAVVCLTLFGRRFATGPGSAVHSPVLPPSAEGSLGITRES